MTMQPAPNLIYGPAEVHATIEPDTYSTFGWRVDVWTSPLTSYRSFTITRAGARRRARRIVARVRRSLERKAKEETIR